jgi:hypothetical protein
MSGPRPLYARVLRLRHLRLRPLVAFLLFEGSIAFAILLVLADLIRVWGVIAIPAAVAVMVKLNDVIAGALKRPLAVAQLRTPRPRDPTAVGRSRVRYIGGRRHVGGRHTGGSRQRHDRPTHDERHAEDLSSDRADASTPEAREPRTWAIARVVARGRATVRTSRSSGPEAVRPDGADRRNRGNSGRFVG